MTTICLVIGCSLRNALRINTAIDGKYFVRLIVFSYKNRFCDIFGLISVMRPVLLILDGGLVADEMCPDPSGIASGEISNAEDTSLRTYQRKYGLH